MERICPAPISVVIVIAYQFLTNLVAVDNFLNNLGNWCWINFLLKSQTNYELSRKGADVDISASTNVNVSPKISRDGADSA